MGPAMVLEQRSMSMKARIPSAPGAGPNHLQEDSPGDESNLRIQSSMHSCTQCEQSANSVVRGERSAEADIFFPGDLRRRTPMVQPWRHKKSKLGVVECDWKLAVCVQIWHHIPSQAGHGG